MGEMVNMIENLVFFWVMIGLFVSAWSLTIGLDESERPIYRPESWLGWVWVVGLHIAAIPVWPVLIWTTKGNWE